MTSDADPNQTGQKTNSAAKVALIGGVCGVLTAVISTLGVIATGWLQYRGPGIGPAQAAVATAIPSTSAHPRGAPHSVPPMIVAPGDGEKVGFCLAVRGVASQPPAGEQYWLLTRTAGPGNRYAYVARSVSTNDGLKWHLPKVGVGTLGDDKVMYDLLLVRTNGQQTRDFNERLQRDNRRLELSDDVQIEDQITVIREPSTSC